jgi:hypothetical protein
MRAIEVRRSVDASVTIASHKPACHAPRSIREEADCMVHVEEYALCRQAGEGALDMAD